MYERILVALDGSECSEQVVPHVAALAATFGSTVILLRVNPPRSSAAVAASTPQDPALVHRLEQQAPEAQLVCIADALGAKGLPVVVEHLMGEPARDIPAYADTHGVDLLAMTTHGRGGLQRVVLGSVAAAVVHAAPCAVLLVRRDESLVRQAKPESVVF
jgi:nucleotide-binding universal stress UspA family protein